MKYAIATIACILAVGCSSDEEPDDGWQFNSETPNEQPEPENANTPTFGDTPETFFPRPDFEDPTGVDCVASTKADADYSCKVTYTPNGGPAKVTNLRFDRWGKLVASEGSEPAEFEYDCDGNLIRSLSGPPGIREVVEHTYENGVLVETTRVDQEDGARDETSYEYDAQGNTSAVTRTQTRADGEVVRTTTSYEYDVDGELTRSVSDGGVTEYWTDERGVEWRGMTEPAGCEFGTLYDRDGNWIESHTRGCDAFGPGHQITTMERDEYGRPLTVTLTDGEVVERHSYEGANPFPQTSWREYIDASYGSQTATLDYEFTLSTLEITATIEATGEPGGKVLFEGVPCFPDEDGLRRGWFPQLALP